MPSTDLLKQFGLQRNPFTDRTAENTRLDTISLYCQSDLRDFQPSETTYVFFGRRGSGKTTIRLQMLSAYHDYNQKTHGTPSRGHFVVDLCKPGHMTACLRLFQEVTRCTTDNWDAVFSENWTSADMVDCILSYAATELIELVSQPGEAASKMLATLKADKRATKQFLMLTHLYAHTDAATLLTLRNKMLKEPLTATQVGGAITAATAAVGAALLTSRDPEVSAALQQPLAGAWERMTRNIAVLHDHPRVAGGVALGLTITAGTLYYHKVVKTASLKRATAISKTVRVVRQQPPEVIAGLVDQFFGPSDGADMVRGMCIGISAHQKLDHLQRLLRLLRYESVAVFGDCFDEVSLLDPVTFPQAIKCFAREVCRNDLLNFGRLHFFFPDSRLALDLNTDKTLKEARFDRHFVRDLAWSRHQLEELAERRFRAAQVAQGGTNGLDKDRVSADGSEPNLTTFSDLFMAVRGEDFASYVGKLQTPRELLIMMTEMFARIEANPEGKLTAQDMEIAVSKAQEQAV